MSQMVAETPKKTRFEISREVRAEFVDTVAQTMNVLTENIRAGQKPAPAPIPFCPMTGFSFAGASMTRLMLESMKRGYSDDRWATFNQLQNYRFNHKEFKTVIKKGEHGVKLLRAEEVPYIEDKEGKWKFLSADQEKYLKEQGAQVRHKTVFYPYTVFNASQITGFPPKENPAPALDAGERNALIDNFIACAGLKVEHGHDQPRYEGSSDTIFLPDPEKFKSPDDYYAMKLRLAFHATAHPDRENREPDNFEIMRGETFSLLAGARLGLPMPMDGGAWPEEKLEGAESWKALQAASDASRILTLMAQFSQGEQPRAKWFTPKEEWPSMSAAQETPAPEPSTAPRMRM